MIKYQEKSKTFSSSLINTSHGFGTKLTDSSVLSKAKFIVKLQQTHSTHIAVINQQENQVIEDCDGVITKEKNITLSVITADCAPIIFNDQVSGIIGISHQGWKGTLNRLPAKMVKEMIKLGSSVENIYCAVGPAINDCCYELYGERLTQFQDTFHTETIYRMQNETYFLNLLIANFLTLSDIGIPFKNIDYFPFCTSCNKEMFYSYHRDKKLEKEMISFISNTYS